jgi:hypothetical protein
MLLPGHTVGVSDHSIRFALKCDNTEDGRHTAQATSSVDRLRVGGTKAALSDPLCCAVSVPRYYLISCIVYAGGLYWIMPTQPHDRTPMMRFGPDRRHEAATACVLEDF